VDRKIWLLNYGADQVVGFSGVHFDRPVTPPRHGFTKFDSSWSVGPETFSVVIPVCFSKLTGHQRGFECFVRHDTQSIINTPPCQEKKVASSIYPLCGRGTTGPTIPVDPSVSCETALFRPRPCPILDLDIDRKMASLPGSSPDRPLLLSGFTAEGSCRAKPVLAIRPCLNPQPYRSPASPEGELQANPSDFCGTSTLVSLCVSQHVLF